MRSHHIAVIAAALAALSVPAAAASVTLRIPYGDLDLAQTDHVDILHKRIKAAAVRACTTDSLFSVPQVDEKCVREATLAALEVAKSRMPAEKLASK